MSGKAPLHAPGGLVYKGYHYEAGTPIPLTDEDAEHLTGTGQVEPLAAAKTEVETGAEDPSTDSPEPAGESAYANLNKAQLEAEFADRGLDLPVKDDGKAATKAMLVDALVADDASKIDG